MEKILEMIHLMIPISNKKLISPSNICLEGGFFMPRRKTKEEIIEEIRNLPEGNEYELLSDYRGNKIPITLLHKTCDRKNDNYIVLNDFLKISNIIITNDELCDSKNRDILLNSVDTTYIEWVFFENDPAKAIKNYMDETINMNEHSDLNIISNILNLSAIYDIPKYSTKLKIKIYEEKE
jgi:hypothetical protein